MVTEETLTPFDHLFELEAPKTNGKIVISMPDLEFLNDIVEIFFKYDVNLPDLTGKMRDFIRKILNAISKS